MAVYLLHRLFSDIAKQRASKGGSTIGMPILRVVDHWVKDTCIPRRCTEAKKRFSDLRDQIKKLDRLLLKEVIAASLEASVFQKGKDAHR
jgi:hypothetical protein